MKFNIVNIMAITIALLILCLSAQTYRADLLKDKKEIAEADRNTAIGLANDKKQESTRYTNAFNSQLTRTKSLEISLYNIQMLRNTERLKYLKQFEGLKKKLSNLEEAISIDAVVDSLPFKTIYVPCKDSVKVFHYQLVDEWNTISAMVIDSPKFEIKVPIRSVVYWQRKSKILWFRMGKKEWFIESYSPNTLVDVDKQELIKVEKK